MLASYDWTASLFGVAAGSAFTAGTMWLLGFRRVVEGGQTLLVPTIRARLPQWEMGRRWIVGIIAVMAVMVTIGMVQLTLFSAEQRERNAHYERCNARFQSTSLELRRIATEDRGLEARDDALRNERDDAMTALVEGLVTPPAEGRRDTRGLLNSYRETTQAIDVKRDELNARRADLERQRRAQPTPPERC